jgi:2-polyprenyl-3-methyl-5-hydroxy-6-metoxy-1,4-benzoquinol methylase
VYSKWIPTHEILSHHYADYPRHNSLSAITRKRYHTLLTSFEQKIKSRNILDVGSSAGIFLTEAKGRGWNVFGLEVDPEIVNHCQAKGITMHLGSLQTFQTSQLFGAITSFEVIEHVNTPKQDTQDIYRLLEPGGVVYITTPNFNALSRKLLKEKWNIIEFPEHLSYFTPRTLKRTLKSAGFSIEKCQTTGFSLARFKESRKSSKHSELETNSDERLRSRIEKNSLLRFVKGFINVILSLFSAGDTIKITARKF